MGRPAAKKGDLCLHAGVVITGSPDTTTCDRASARIGDIHTCVSHPPGNPPAGPGPIVTASRTVFINRQRAARIGDTLACGSGGSAPPGTADPKVKSYEVREQDSYHKLMRLEHEVAARDRVRDVAEPERGKVTVVLEPEGVGDAEVPKTESVATAVPSGRGESYSGPLGTGNPHAGAASMTETPAQTITQDSTVDSRAEATPVVRAAPSEEGEERSDSPHRLRLRFSMDLAVGSRRRKRGGGGGIDKIIAPFCNVIIGG